MRGARRWRSAEAGSALVGAKKRITLCAPREADNARSCREPEPGVMDRPSRYGKGTGLGRMDMERFYPIFLNLEDKPVIVIGGGHVAAEKVAGLRRAGARITLVAPELLPELAALRDTGEIEHIA